MTTTRNGAVLAGALMLGGAPAAAAPFEDAFFFGDSLTDCCVLGRFTQGDTPNWADLLPPLIGADYVASEETNYAVGGAQSGLSNVIGGTDETLGRPTGFLSQVARFEASGTAVGPDDIAGVWVGTNDIWPSALEAPDLGGLPLSLPLGVRPEPEALAELVVGNVAEGIGRLRDAGFRNFVVLSPYDLADTGFTPPSEAEALATAYSDATRDGLAELYTPGADTWFVDVFELLEEVQANADAFGFDFLTGDETCEANDCASLSLEQQNRYIFADAIHLTNGFNRIIAQRAASVIEEGEPVPAPIPLPGAAGFALAGLGALGALRAQRRGA